METVVRGDPCRPVLCEVVRLSREDEHFHLERVGKGFLGFGLSGTCTRRLVSFGVWMFEV